MSHDLTVREDGTVEMFSTGQEPVWHRLGQRTETAVTSAAAIRMAGLDWSVDERPLATVDTDDNLESITSHKAIVRCDNHAVLGVVGTRYTPLQNDEAFEWLDSVVGKRLRQSDRAGRSSVGELQDIQLERNVRDRFSCCCANPHSSECIFMTRAPHRSFGRRVRGRRDALS